MMTLRGNERIITVSPVRLGDTIFRTPLFRLIKTKYPHAMIDVVALSPLAQAVLQDNPYIHQVLNERDTDAVREKYDLAIMIHESLQAQAFLQLFPVPRVDFKREHYPGRHEAEKLLDFFSETFQCSRAGFDSQYDIFLRKEHREKIKQFWSHHQVTPETWLVGFHMGCHGLAKKRTRFWNRYKHKKAWPVKYFAILANQLMKQFPKLRIVLTGSANEKFLGDYLSEEVPNIINLMGQTTIHETVALMSFLKLLVTNDTGTLHLACAVSIPLIALYGEGGDPVSHGPYPMNAQRIVLHKNQIEKITPQEVWNAALRLLLPKV